MPNINDIIRGAGEDDNFLGSLSVNHERRLLGSIRTLRENILDSMNKLETTPSGKLRGVKTNLKQTQKIHKKLVSQFEKDYNVNVNSILGSFSQIDRVIKRRYKSLDEAIEFTGIDKTMMDALKSNTYNRYIEFGEDARNRIASVMYNSVAGGAKFSTLVNTVTGILIGHRDARGRPMTIYAKGFAQDAIMNYHNQVNIKKGEDVGFKHFLYYGNVINTSRRFCITRVGKVYNKRQIQAWDSLNWQGKAASAWTDRGGYNCRHHWRPVRKEWMEDEKGEEVSRSEILGEMTVPYNRQAASLSEDLSKNRKALEKLEEKEKALKKLVEEMPTAKEKSISLFFKMEGQKKKLTKQIEKLRIEIGTIGKKTIKITKKKIAEKIPKVIPKKKIVKKIPVPKGIPVLDKETKSFVGKVKYYVKNQRSVGMNSKMFKHWDGMEGWHKQYFLDLWEDQGIDVSNYKHLVSGVIKKPIPKIPPVIPKVTPKVIPIPKPKVPPKVAPKGIPVLDKKTKEFIGKVKYYVKSGKSVGHKSKMFAYWDSMEDWHKQYYLDLWESEGYNISRFPQLFPTGKVIPKAKVIPITTKPKLPVPPPVKSIEEQLGDLGYQYFVDANSGTKYAALNFEKEYLIPLRDEAKRLDEAFPGLSWRVKGDPVKEFFIHGKSRLSDVGYPKADGLYSGGYSRRVTLARGGELRTAEVLNHKVGRWSVSSQTDSSITVFRHEMGHHVQKILQDSYSVFHIEWDNIWASGQSDFFQTYLTQYSGTNKLEAFAETFALYTSKSYKRGWLPKVLEDYMDNLLNTESVLQKATSLTAELEAASVKSAEVLASIAKPPKMAKALEAIKDKYARTVRTYKKDGKDVLDIKWFRDNKLVTNKGIVKKLNKLGMPPGWKNVVGTIDPKVKLIGGGKDAAGRWQYAYSAKAKGESKIKIFDRQRSFARGMAFIREEIEKGILDGDDRAFLLSLENKTAIRIGSDKDFRSKVKAYGLTTLQYEHVTIKGNKIILDFIAKKGGSVTYELTDSRLARWLKSKKAVTEKGERLFPGINGKKLNKYLKEISGKKYTVKDFRTYHGTRIAYNELKKYANKVLTLKEKKDIIRSVSEMASRFLKNSPSMALNSYINPSVWDMIGGLL